MNSFIQLIQNKYEQLSRSHREISEYITMHYKEAAFMNSVALAKKMNVSNPTIIRYAAALGFSSYSEYQQALQAAVQNELSSVDRISLIQASEGQGIVEEVFKGELKNITTNLQKLDPAVIKSVADVLISNDLILISGNQVSSMLAEYTSYSLGKIRNNVARFDEVNLDIENRIKGKKCAALVFALPRYPNKTIEQIKWLNKRNIPIIVITNNELFPFQKYTETIISVSIEYISYIDPISAILCVINSILIEAANNKRNNTSEILDEFESYVLKNDIYFSN